MERTIEKIEKNITKINMADGRRKNGGARPGAGRKPNAVKFESEITAADKRIAANLVRYIANMEQLADGVMVEERDPITQKLIVYQRAPDRQANEYLINRIMGKPAERRVLEFEKPLEEMTDDELRVIAEG